jgi:histidinol-phosphate aminotransferase
LEAADIRSKMLFLCSPNNPTGNSFSMERVEELLQRFNGLVVIDEAYIDFSDAKSWLEKLKNYPNLVITQTLSKAYGLAGIRLGICYASKEIIAILNTIKPPYNVNELSQQKAIERLLQPDEVTQEILKIKEERANLVSNLKTINYVQEIYPSACNFVLVKVDNATKRYDQLIAKGIVIRNRTTQPLCKNCLRLTVGTRLENSRLIHVLKEI